MRSVLRIHWTENLLHPFTLSSYLWCAKGSKLTENPAMNSTSLAELAMVLILACSACCWSGYLWLLSWRCARFAFVARSKIAGFRQLNSLHTYIEICLFGCYRSHWNVKSCPSLLSFLSMDRQQLVASTWVSSVDVSRKDHLFCMILLGWSSIGAAVGEPVLGAEIMKIKRHTSRHWLSPSTRTSLIVTCRGLVFQLRTLSEIIELYERLPR